MAKELYVKYGLGVEGTGSNVFYVDGTAGRLFAVDDTFSGSLFSVNTIAGLPIMEAFSDNTVRMGQYGRQVFFISQSRVGVGKETLLNSTLDVSGSMVVTGSFGGAVVSMSIVSMTASLNCALGNIFSLTLSSSATTHLTASNIRPGQTINLRITQQATSGALSYSSQFRFPVGAPYTASATSSVTDILSFIAFDANTLFGSSLKNYI